MKIILASQSPRRREILQLMEIPFEVIESHVQEIPPVGASPEELVKALAEQKARAVFALHPEDCVIGADTVVDLDGRVLGKPHTPERAKEYLPGHVDIRSARTDVTFRPMSDEEIDWYVGTGDPLDKAGSYGVQGPASLFVDHLEGNYFNIIGMPAPTLYEMLLDAHVIDQRHQVL